MRQTFITGRYRGPRWPAAAYEPLPHGPRAPTSETGWQRRPGNPGSPNALMHSSLPRGAGWLYPLAQSRPRGDMTIRDWPKDERPREKLLLRGPASLSDAELLAVFLRTGVRGKTAVNLARELLRHFGGLTPLLDADRQRSLRSQWHRHRQVCAGPSRAGARPPLSGGAASSRG